MDKSKHKHKYGSKYDFDITGVGEGYVKLPEGKLHFTSTDISLVGAALSLPITRHYVKNSSSSHVRELPESIIGNDWKLNIEQYLVHGCDSDSIDDCAYHLIDSENNKHDFTLRYYYEIGDVKEYIDKSKVVIDIDGGMTYTYGGISHSVKEEIKSCTNKILHATKHGLSESLKDYEQRSEEIAQLEDQKKSFDDRLDQLKISANMNNKMLNHMSGVSDGGYNKFTIDELTMYYNNIDIIQNISSDMEERNISFTDNIKCHKETIMGTNDDIASKIDSKPDIKSESTYRDMAILSQGWIKSPVVDWINSEKTTLDVMQSMANSANKTEWFEFFLNEWEDGKFSEFKKGNVPEDIERINDGYNDYNVTISTASRAIEELDFAKTYTNARNDLADRKNIKTANAYNMAFDKKLRPLDRALQISRLRNDGKSIFDQIDQINKEYSKLIKKLVSLKNSYPTVIIADGDIMYGYAAKCHYTVENESIQIIGTTSDINKAGDYYVEISTYKIIESPYYRLVLIFDSKENQIVIDYIGDKVNYIADNSGSKLDFKYAGSDLVKIVTRNGDSVSYIYNGRNLSSIKYGDGEAINIKSTESCNSLSFYNSQGTGKVLLYNASNQVQEMYDVSLIDGISKDSKFEYTGNLLETINADTRVLFNYQNEYNVEVQDKHTRKAYAFNDEYRPIIEYLDDHRVEQIENIDILSAKLSSIATHYDYFDDDNRSNINLIELKVTGHVNANNLLLATGYNYFAGSVQFGNNSFCGESVCGTPEKENIIFSSLKGSQPINIGLLNEDNYIFECLCNHKCSTVSKIVPRVKLSYLKDGVTNSATFTQEVYTNADNWIYVSVPIAFGAKDNFVLDKEQEYSVKIDFVSASGAEVEYKNISMIAGIGIAMSYDGYEKLIKVDDFYNKSTEEFVYNANDKLISKTLKYHGTKLKGKEYSEIHSYTSSGQLSKVKSYDGMIEEYAYNDKGQEINHYQYSQLSPSIRFSEEVEYDELGRLLKQFNPQGDANTEIRYKGTSSLVEKSILPSGCVITTSNDFADNYELQIATELDNEEISNRFEYCLGGLVSVAHNDFEYRYEYDKFGRLINISTCFDDNVKKYLSCEYLDSSSMDIDNGTSSVKVTNAEGGIYYVTYIGGKLNNIDYSASCDSARVRLKEYGYVDHQLVIIYDYSSEVPQKTLYVRDKFGEVIEERTNDYTIMSSIDEDRSLSRTSIDYTNSSNTTIDYTYSDTLEHRLIGLRYSSGLSQSLRYDNLHRLCAISNNIASKKYSYLTCGDRTTNYICKERHAQGSKVDNTRYTYDASGNITQVIENNIPTIRYQYDKLCRLTREDNKQLSKSFIFMYDIGGNITDRYATAYTLDDIDLSTAEHIPYTYVMDGWNDQILSYNGETFAYDNIGNPTTYRGKKLNWSHGRNLYSIKAVDGNNDVSYTYNADGIRRSKSYKEVTTNYILSDTKILAEKRTSTTATTPDFIEYHYGADGILGLSYNGVQYIYRKNIQGDITHIYDTLGNLHATYTYDAWGNHKVYDNNGVDITANMLYNTDINASDSEEVKSNKLDELAKRSHIGNINPIRYRGYYYDVESNLYYLNTRYYDPQIGRFINADEITILDETQSQIHGLNLYMYCGNNPVGMIDPSGMKPKWWQWVLFGIGAALVVAAAVVAIVSTGGAATGVIGAIAIGAAKGAVIGAVVGSAVGIAGGAIYAGVTGADMGESILSGFLIGFGVGAIAGAVIGGAVGGINFGSFASNTKLNSHFAKHGKEFNGLFNSSKEYAKGAKYVRKNGIYVKEMNGYIKFFGAGGKANYAFVGVTKNGFNVTTFGIRKVSHLIKSGVKWLI